ncbi:unnamed protein product [Cuscuta europaea]|uniref:Uncharacterized protein n=1 Tax=Cuscuta europaea TaxID=41803 RepID=A0A9P1E0M4_CUSEU|nr:unnamed protein product [Cuscuta europaea]
MVSFKNVILFGWEKWGCYNAATQEALQKQGDELKTLGLHQQATTQQLHKLDQEIKEEVKVDVTDLRNLVTSFAIEVNDLYPRRTRQIEVDSDPEIEALFKESQTPAAAKKGGNTTQAGPSSTRSLAAKKTAETRKKNKLYKEEAEIRRRKAEEAKAKEEPKKKQEEDKQE